ncbi:MAG: hypothetical protein IMY86_13945 [Chloroflexi bacterium]|nr:hypothetical protein [Chloroflexota bacterium]
MNDHEMIEAVAQAQGLLAAVQADLAGRLLARPDDRKRCASCGSPRLQSVAAMGNLDQVRCLTCDCIGPPAEVKVEEPEMKEG